MSIKRDQCGVSIRFLAPRFFPSRACRATPLVELYADRRSKVHQVRDSQYERGPLE